MTIVKRKPVRVTKQMLIGSYNVRSLSVDKQYQLTIGCQMYEIDIVAIQEHRQRFDEEINFKTLEVDNKQSVLIRSSASSSKVGEVGLYISHRVHQYLLLCAKKKEHKEIYFESFYYDRIHNTC